MCIIVLTTNKASLVMIGMKVCVIASKENIGADVRDDEHGDEWSRELRMGWMDLLCGLKRRGVVWIVGGVVWIVDRVV